MSNFSSSEKIIANFLSKFPRLKSTIKKLYSIANFHIYKKKYTYKTDLHLSVVNSSDTTESFFGYYDKSPVNTSNSYIIFHKIDDHSTSKLPNPNNPVNIMLQNVKTGKYQKIASSPAYNWQQGTKLQWLTESKFIYNDFEDEKYISKIYNIENKSFETINFPIYDCHNDEFALSLDFSRLNALNTDYGYRNIQTGPDLEKIKDDGIFYVDLRTNKVELLISIEKIIDLHFKENMTGAKHTFNHIMLSPDGENFIFIHRWYQAGIRYDSLILSNIEGTEIEVLSDDDMVSHCCWYDNTNIVGYFRDKDLGENFYKINTTSNIRTLLSEKLKNFGDGHPSFHRNKMLFDSYPDRSRMQHLYIYDIESDSVNEIGEFYESLKYYGETRCDLHPRWSKDGKQIFFDSVHEGKRYLYFNNTKQLMGI